ncbi:hypothetical protein TNIN_12961 [Trichonephila inaurata madagascariensis]|uniref:Ankyrin repeat protein n=1 Tax=Trichonephila inaurata madagascariensis TaxID=2747483 RepID=A0A8X7CD78_9ARAC|nr:hypothetical protein TNIN_12961 [Trichonephila inaurata madagascariensis]
MGYTPLMYSVKDNRVFVAERFLDMGMDINIKGTMLYGLAFIEFSSRSAESIVFDIGLSIYSKAKIRGLEACDRLEKLSWISLKIVDK